MWPHIRFLFIKSACIWYPDIARSALCIHLLPAGQTTVAIMCNKI